LRPDLIASPPLLATKPQLPISTINHDLKDSDSDSEMETDSVTSAAPSNASTTSSIRLYKDTTKQQLATLGAIEAIKDIDEATVSDIKSVSTAKYITIVLIFAIANLQQMHDSIRAGLFFGSQHELNDHLDRLSNIVKKLQLYSNPLFNEIFMRQIATHIDIPEGIITIQDLLIESTEQINSIKSGNWLSGVQQPPETLPVRVHNFLTSSILSLYEILRNTVKNVHTFAKEGDLAINRMFFPELNLRADEDIAKLDENALRPTEITLPQAVADYEIANQEWKQILQKGQQLLYESSEKGNASQNTNVKSESQPASVSYVASNASKSTEKSNESLANTVLSYSIQETASSSAGTISDIVTILPKELPNEDSISKVVELLGKFEEELQKLTSGETDQVSDSQEMVDVAYKQILVKPKNGGSRRRRHRRTQKKVSSRRRNVRSKSQKRHRRAPRIKTRRARRHTKKH
jgi:hypothetical protein